LRNALDSLIRLGIRRISTKFSSWTFSMFDNENMAFCRVASCSDSFIGLCLHPLVSSCLSNLLAYLSSIYRNFHCCCWFVSYRNDNISSVVNCSQIVQCQSKNIISIYLFKFPKANFAKQNMFKSNCSHHDRTER